MWQFHPGPGKIHFYLPPLHSFQSSSPTLLPAGKIKDPFFFFGPLPYHVRTYGHDDQSSSVRNFPFSALVQRQVEPTKALLLDLAAPVHGLWIVLAGGHYRWHGYGRNCQHHEPFWALVTIFKNRCLVFLLPPESRRTMGDGTNTSPSPFLRSGTPSTNHRGDFREHTIK